MNGEVKQEQDTYSDYELALIDQFIELVLSGKSPGVERFLERHPRVSKALRPVLEGAEIVEQEIGIRSSKEAGK